MIANRADSFLRLIRRSQRGKLKIYLGYCAGVGKTYQMLLRTGIAWPPTGLTSSSAMSRPTAGPRRRP